jgi:hypothetical protein
MLMNDCHLSRRMNVTWWIIKDGDYLENEAGGNEFVKLECVDGVQFTNQSSELRLVLC